MKFLEKNHQYLNEQDEVYTSVTTLIKKYEPQKDWNEIAEKYAKKNKRTVEDVRAEWKAEGDKAIAKGTAFHNKMEALYNDKGSIILEENECKVFPSPIIEGVKYAKDLKLSKGIYPELLIFSHRYKVAGQADLIEVVNNKINVKDYKTNKEIKMESYKHWKNGQEMMLYPVNNLMNCNYWHYCLQLNLYMLMLKSHNPKLKQGTMEIQHVESDSNIRIYKVPDLQKEAKNILEHHLANLK